MFSTGQPRRRWGRSPSRDFVLMLLVLFVLLVTTMRFVGPIGPPDTRSLGQRLLATLLRMVQCFGLFVAVGFTLALFEMLKHHLARSYARRMEDKLAGLTPLTHDARRVATPANLSAVLDHLEDANFALRHQALRAAFCLLRADPGLGAATPTRALLERALPDACGFTQTLAETPAGESLLTRVTLGGKLGAGTVEKRLAPVTSGPARLAHWVELHHPNPGKPVEIQVSVGFDTGPLPSLEERARFLGLYLFVCTTDLDRFQALTRRPHRDPNAAFGLVIRGDIVEPRYPGQSSGHRLDYVFPLPDYLSTANLAGLFQQIQLLNLGLLAACAADASRVLLGPPPAWLDAHRLGLARIHARFERRLVRLLRSFDGHRDPDQIHPLDEDDHAERVHAFAHYRLEECLYPYYHWIVPLYSLDTRWDRLLEPLRAVEAMLLHQGPASGGGATRGSEFIRQVRLLGYQTAEAISQALEGRRGADPAESPPVPHDPFIDPADEEATRHYLRRVSQALAGGRMHPEELPDPATFRHAADYYAVSPTGPPERNP